VSKDKKTESKTARQATKAGEKKKTAAEPEVQHFLVTNALNVFAGTTERGTVFIRRFTKKTHIVQLWTPTGPRTLCGERINGYRIVDKEHYAQLELCGPCVTPVSGPEQEATV
jgi:hypothetical protein